MFGNNPKLKPEKGDGSVLKVHKIFPTFQGEGPFSGYPAVFIRLAGCNLACKFCDTEFESFDEMSLDFILQRVEELKQTKSPLIVITGGEPFRQEIGPLCNCLIKLGMKVQIETNGLLYRPIPKEVSIVCSPKNQGFGYRQIRLDILEQCIAIKFIVSAVDDNYSSIAEVGQTEHNIPVYLQPMDEYDVDKNSKNLKLAIELCNQHGYILGTQMHKVVGLD